MVSIVVVSSTLKQTKYEGNHFRQGERYAATTKAKMAWLGPAQLMTSLSTTVPAGLCSGVSEASRMTIRPLQMLSRHPWGCFFARVGSPHLWDICLRMVGVWILW